MTVLTVRVKERVRSIQERKDVRDQRQKDKRVDRIRTMKNWRTASKGIRKDRTETQ